MKRYKFEPKGVCPKEIEVSLDGDIIHDLIIKGGCSGNGQALSALSENMPTKEFINKLEGIKCGYRDTSCPDQIAQFLKIAFMKKPYEII